MKGLEVLAGGLRSTKVISVEGHAIAHEIGSGDVEVDFFASVMDLENLRSRSLSDSRPSLLLSGSQKFFWASGERAPAFFFDLEPASLR